MALEIIACARSACHAGPDELALEDETGFADIGRNGTHLLKDNARWLLEKPGHLVLIEGHTDYKGLARRTSAIGERRAKAIAKKQ